MMKRILLSFAFVTASMSFANGGRRPTTDPGSDLAPPPPAALNYPVRAEADLVNYINNVYFYAPVKETTVSSKTIKRIFEKTASNPVARHSSRHRYDPTGEIGFCFGRGLTSTLYARLEGAAPKSVNKFYVVGDLRSADGSTQWWFHTTTIVNTGNGWRTIDPIFSRDLSLAEWVANVTARWDRWHGGAPKARYYRTHALAFTPRNRLLDGVTGSFPEEATGINGISSLNVGSVGLFDNFLHSYRAPNRYPAVLAMESYNGYFIDLINSLPKVPARAPLMVANALREVEHEEVVPVVIDPIELRDAEIVPMAEGVSEGDLGSPRL